MTVQNLLSLGQHRSTNNRRALANHSSPRNAAGKLKCEAQVPSAHASVLPAVLLRGASRKGQLCLCVEAAHLPFGLPVYSSPLSTGRCVMSAVRWPSHPLEAVVSGGVEHAFAFLGHCRLQCGLHTSHLPVTDCWWAGPQPLLQLQVLLPGLSQLLWSPGMCAQSERMCHSKIWEIYFVVF